MLVLYFEGSVIDDDRQKRCDEIKESLYENGIATCNVIAVLIM